MPLLVDSDEPRDTHAIACLIGYGADAICRGCAGDRRGSRLATDRRRSPPPDEAQSRLVAALEEGVLRSCPRWAYPTSRAIEARASSKPSVSIATLSGISRRYALRNRWCARALRARGTGTPRASGAGRPRLENPGYYQFRKGGEATRPTPRSSLRCRRQSRRRMRFEPRRETRVSISTNDSRRLSTSVNLSSRGICWSSFRRRSGSAR